MDETLHELARAHGIALAYYDIWGKQHHPSAQALRDLFAAMGIAAGSEIEAAQRLREHTFARCREVIAPALILRSHEFPWRIELRLREALHTATLAWHLREESGRTHSGEFDPSSLPQLGEIEIEGERVLSRSLTLAVPLPLGYHEVCIRAGEQTLATAMLAIVPARCFMPGAIEGHGRIWGVAAQLYAVRSQRNWGMGDFTDLRALVDFWGSRGADIIGLSPLHALYAHAPAHCSPYSPNSRLFKQWLYIDVEACVDYADCDAARARVGSEDFQRRLRTLRDADWVDYAGVAAVKREVLELLYAEFRATRLAGNCALARAFRSFQQAGGDALRHFALFEALQEKFADADAGTHGWRSWSEAFRDPASPQVQQFLAEHLGRVEFFEYLQWQADMQLGAAGKRCLELGLGVGIYEDLAVSADRDGAEAWVNRDLLALDASIGAPPDELNLKGQDWGLPPFDPERLRVARYAPFIALLRANMYHSGALRIDHVMALMRLYWVPPRGSAVEGVYVHYPFDDLLGLVALESQRNACMLIGEDLGTVPDEVRAGLYAAGVLSYRVLYFERDQRGEFKPPADYPEQALVVAATHDLPTVAGWWQGQDIAVRTELDLFPSEAVKQAHIDGRAHDRVRLLAAMAHAGKLPGNVVPEPSTLAALPHSLIVALHAYLAATPAKVLAAQLEDVLGAADQVNVPGTTARDYRNWARKLTLDLEHFDADLRVKAFIEALTHARPSPRAK
jgi:(1->4)-alpha-D-glucan 1-alpha-D-glucosylmutase